MYERAGASQGLGDASECTMHLLVEDLFQVVLPHAPHG